MPVGLGFRNSTRLPEAIVTAHESSPSWQCFRRQAPMGVVIDGPPWNQHQFWQRVLGTCYCGLNIEPSSGTEQHAIRELMDAMVPR
jgi:hypothetical protein